MAPEHLALIAIVAGLVLMWITGIVVIRRRQQPKPPEPTPWADSTNVARYIRETEDQR